MWNRNLLSEIITESDGLGGELGVASADERAEQTTARRGGLAGQNATC
jgi:hypothetical protein